MGPTTFQTHLHVTTQTWNRLQGLLMDGEVEIDGTKLDIPGVVAVACHDCIPKITESPKTLKKIEASIQLLKERLEKGYSVYGVNTGFGGSADSRTEKMVDLQSALLQLTQAGVLLESDKSEDASTLLASHAMPASWVKGTIIARCNSNLRGHSAVSVPVLQSMVQLLLHRVTPIVPLRGSISASGDLMPLSYIADTIEGSPDVYVRVQGPHRTQIMKSSEGLQSVGIAAQKLGPKEGLGLIDGTSTSAAVASLVLYETNQLAVLVQALSAMGLEALMGTAESFHSFISAARPHDGQNECSNNLLFLLQGSRLVQGLDGHSEQDRPGLIQDRYALRCVPQWIGPQLEDLLLANRQVTVELNSTCDNPLVDVESGNVFSGGNFQAASITSAMEKTRLCLQMFGRLIFSQATEMIDPSLNNGLPTNLVADDPSLSFTMKELDISMASYMSELGYLSNPVTINSMALVSSRYSMQAVEVLSLMCACDLYIVCQALDLRALHLAFLDCAKSEMQTVTSSSFSKYLSEAELADLNDSLNQHLLHLWPTTNRLNPHDRLRTVIEDAMPVLINQTWTQEPGLKDLTEWKIQACISLNAVYQRTADVFFLKQHTADILGQGARILYGTVRQQLGVPFHQGFVEHPTPENETLDDRLKKTIGSWISIIYQAIRDGRLMGPLMQSLGSTTGKTKISAKRKAPVAATMASTRARRLPRQSEPEPDLGAESEVDHGPSIQDASKPKESAGPDTPSVAQTTPPAP
ncbi:L-Aspartase-like protein [Aspergillus filifer]